MAWLPQRFLPETLLMGTALLSAARALVCTARSPLDFVSQEFARPVQPEELSAALPSTRAVGSVAAGEGAAALRIGADELPEGHPWLLVKRGPMFEAAGAHPSTSAVIVQLAADEDEEVRVLEVPWHSRLIRLAIDSRSYDWSRFLCYLKWAEEMVSVVRKDVAKLSQREVVFVDVGCGSGWFSVLLKAAFPEPWFRVYCSDISSGALSLAQENIELNALDVSLLYGSELQDLCSWVPGGDACGAPFEGKIDYVYFYPPQMEESFEQWGRHMFVTPDGYASDIFTPERLRHFESIMPQLRQRLRKRGRAFLGVDRENMAPVTELIAGSAEVSARIAWDAWEDRNSLLFDCPSSLVEVRVARRGRAGSQ